MWFYRHTGLPVVIIMCVLPYIDLVLPNRIVSVETKWNRTQGATQASREDARVRLRFRRGIRSSIRKRTPIFSEERELLRFLDSSCRAVGVVLDIAAVGRWKPRTGRPERGGGDALMSCMAVVV